MKTNTLISLLIIGFGLPTDISAADVFDRHSMYWLKQAAKGKQPTVELSLEQAAKLKPLAKNITSPCVVIKTDEDNWTKAMLGWGFRKGKDKPIPVLLIERFVTYRGDRPNIAAASGKDIMLFAGFSFNFDIGQVVPAGQGGDIEFTDKSVVKPSKPAELYLLDESQIPAPRATDKYDPNDHEGVRPRDFSGTWDVNVDGRWKGQWEITVEENRQAYGKYTSDESKSTYEISGRVATTPHQIKLTVELANSRQSVDAFLWTTDKSKMAGTVTIAGRKFGFLATRNKK